MFFGRVLSLPLLSAKTFAQDSSSFEMESFGKRELLLSCELLSFSSSSESNSRFTTVDVAVEEDVEASGVMSLLEDNPVGVVGCLTSLILLKVLT